jgi:hypothetical protein
MPLLGFVVRSKNCTNATSHVAFLLLKNLECRVFNCDDAAEDSKIFV